MMTRMNCRGRGRWVVAERSAPGRAIALAASIGGMFGTRLFERERESAILGGMRCVDCGGKRKKEQGKRGWCFELC